MKLQERRSKQRAATRVKSSSPPGAVVKIPCNGAEASQSPVVSRAQYIAGRQGHKSEPLASLQESILSAGPSASFSDSWLHLIFSLRPLKTPGQKMSYSTSSESETEQSLSSTSLLFFNARTLQQWCQERQ